MFKLLHPTLLLVPIAWAALVLLQILDAVTPILQHAGLAPTRSWVVMTVQAIGGLVFLTPAWRIVWRVVPQLNDWFYPDLNGEWDMELESNFARIVATLDAAAGSVASLDVRLCPPSALQPLQHSTLRARITQGWVQMDMEVWDPSRAGAIRRSETIAVAPFRGRHGRHGLAYIFEQENDTDVLSDDRKFQGAARMERERDRPGELNGRMFNDRMWRRGMNTAADVRMTRTVPWRSWWAVIGGWSARMMGR